ncbi:dimethylarginine dimethylaminohydrolase family protein [Enterococcus olivae]
MYVNNGTGELKQILLSEPSNVQGAEQLNEIAKKWEMEAIDETLVKQEFRQLRELYVKLGVEVNVVTPPETMPHAVFARDLGGCVKEGVVLGNFKRNIRKTETKFFQAALEELNISVIGEVVGEGTFEGGDFAFLNERTLAVGLLDRTNEAGFQQLQTILEPLGYILHAVPMKAEYLHLDMCFNLVTPDTAIAYKKGLPATFLEVLDDLGITLIEGGESEVFHHGYNVQALGNRQVISLKQNTKINQAMRQREIEVHEIDITETLKLGGGIHCMTFPLKRI